MMSVYNVELILDNLGLEYSVRGIEANALCPMHEAITGRPDRSPSWWINIETGAHICFSCHYKGNVVQLVCDVKKLYFSNNQQDYNSAIAWISTLSEVNVELLAEKLLGLPVYIQQAKNLLPMNEARLAVFTEPPEHALLSRSITAEKAKEYEVLWDPKTSTWILPLREPHFNALLGWQEKGTVHRTFKNRPAGLKKSSTLFGVKNQLEEQVIVVESPLDCVRIASAGFPGAVAICGSSVSEQQVKILRYSDKIICAFDNPNIDKAGRKACEEMLGFAKKYGLNLFFFNYGDSNKKDPGEMTNSEIAWGVENAQSVILGEFAYVQRDAQTLPNRSR
jgi:hypothetical protein